MRISDWSSDVCSSDLVVAFLDDAGDLGNLDVELAGDDAGAATQVEAQAVVAEVLLAHDAGAEARQLQRRAALRTGEVFTFAVAAVEAFDRPVRAEVIAAANAVAAVVVAGRLAVELELGVGVARSEEHTSELQSLMRISYAVLCLKKNK